MSDHKPKKILVIKLSALGDFAQALGPMAAIRRHHQGAHITLMTTKMFQGFAQDCGYFDDIWIHDRPHWMQPLQWLALRNKLNADQYDCVYDLQNNDRTSFYLRLFKTQPQSFSTVANATHRNTVSDRRNDHAYDRHVQTLKLAGIHDVAVDRFDWVQADTARFNIKSPYILFIPGSSPQHPYKRWPVDSYGKLAKILVQRGYNIVILGTDIERDLAAQIKLIEPSCVDLTGRSSLYDVIALGRDAAACVGNDSGPTQLIAPTGCPVIALYSGHSNPVQHRPLGSGVLTLQENDIADISVETVLSNLKLDAGTDTAPSKTG